MGLPIVISESDFGTFETNGVETTPLAKIAVRFSEAVINEAWAQANTKADALSTKITAMGAAVDALIATPGTLHVTAGSVTGATATEPTVSIPATAAVAARKREVAALEAQLQVRGGC